MFGIKKIKYNILVILLDNNQYERTVFLLEHQVMPAIRIFRVILNEILQQKSILEIIFVTVRSARSVDGIV